MDVHIQLVGERDTGTWIFGRRRDNFLLTAACVPLGLGAWRFEPQAELAHEW